MIALLAVLAAATFAPSISIDEPAPTFGQTVTFTAVYPSAARKKIGTRQKVQPQIDVYCSQNGTLVYWQVTSMQSEQNLGGGWWQGETGSVLLGGVSNMGLAWGAGAADCEAVVGYYTTDQTGALYWHDVADEGFTVAA